MAVPFIVFKSKTFWQVRVVTDYSVENPEDTAILPDPSVYTLLRKNGFSDYNTEVMDHAVAKCDLLNYQYAIGDIYFDGVNYIWRGWKNAEAAKRAPIIPVAMRIEIEPIKIVAKGTVELRPDNNNEERESVATTGDFRFTDESFLDHLDL